MKIQTKKVIDVSDWNAFVSETYGGRMYNFQQQDGCKDRGSVLLTVPFEDAWDYEDESVPEEVNGKQRGVSFEAWLKRSPETPIKDQTHEYQKRLWWERNFYPSVEMIANDLHARRLLEAGEYTIDIDW